MPKLRYVDFASRIDLDKLYEAIGFEPTSSKGDEDTGQCPDLWGMHKNGDQTGKFSVNRDKKVYNCWVCGGGSLLSLAMEFSGDDPEEATHWLYQFTQTEQTQEEFVDEMESLLADPDDRVPVMPYYNERVLNRWSEDIPAWFLKQRHISEDVAKQYKLRYVAEATRFCPKGIGDDNYVGPAIVFPHYWRGRLVGWQQRWLDDARPKWIPKYTNTPDFPKSETVYNYDDSQFAGRPIVLVESVPTVLYLLSLGYPAIATFGGPKESQLKLLRTLKQGIIIAPDNDDPGIMGRDNITHYLERYIPIEWVAPVDKGPGADLGDLKPDEVRQHLASATTPIEYGLTDL